MPTITGATYNQEKVFTADVTGDNFMDIVWYNETTGEIQLLEHNTNVTTNGMNFAKNNSFTTNLISEILLDVKDINGDGKADILTYKTGLINDEIYYYPSTGAAFNNAILVCNTLPHATYQIETIDINNDGKLDIFALNKATSIVYSGIFTTSLPITINQLSLTNSIPNNAIVHILKGHFKTILNNDICLVIETPISTTSNYLFQVLENNGAAFTVSITSLQNGNASMNQKFYEGKFTHDDYSDIAVYAEDGFVYMVENINGNLLAFSINPWQSTLSTPPGTNFILDAGNYSSNNSYDDMLLLETSAVTTPSNLGKTYLEINSTINFTINELQIVPCNSNSIALNSFDYKIVHADFNNDGIMDFVLYNSTSTLPVLKIGILNTVGISNVEGYCWPFSAAPNDNIDFYVSGTAMSGNIEIYRHESRNDNVNDIYYTTIPINIVQRVSNANLVQNGCGWSSTYSLQIPPTWPSGYYSAKVTNANCQSTSINFIVKKDPNNISLKKVVLLANTNTWVAYNTYSDGFQAGSKYGNSYITSKYQEYSLMRPIANNGIKDNSRPHLARAELWIYTWLLDNGYDPDVITDIDLDLNTNNFLNNYDYFVMGTHPEYWTGDMYDHVKDFQINGANGNGGNLICLGGNAVFEVVDLDFASVLNPKLIAYPNALGGATLQQNSQYPLAGMEEVGDELNSSPFLVGTNNLFDRFDYYLESYNFGSNSIPVLKRTIDLTGVHYQNINSIGVNNTSFTVNTSMSGSPLFQGITYTIVGDHGYCSQDGVRPIGDGKAAGWEADRYSPNVAPYNNPIYPLTFTNNLLDPLTPASPANTLSIYDNDIQILASATPNEWSNPQVYFYSPIAAVYCPNGMNNAEIIYVPKDCATHRGFVFTTGSITFGGSLVWNYNSGVYNNDLSRMMNNVLNHSEITIVKADVINCSGTNTLGSITMSSSFVLSSGNATYTLMPNNVTNATGFFDNLSVGTYTVSVSVGGQLLNCQQVEIIQSNSNSTFCCNLTLAQDPTIIQIDNNTISSTSLGSSINGQTFYVNGTLTIDQSTIFTGCTFYFTPNAQIAINNNFTLQLDDCTLQGACGTWTGIDVANLAKLVTTGTSNIKDMYLGIQVGILGNLEATNTHFLNNNTSITFEDIDASTYTGFVRNCTFKTDGNSSFGKADHGIVAINCKGLDLGNPCTASNYNEFENLYNAVYIHNLIPNTANFNLSFNKFKDITGGRTLWPDGSWNQIAFNNDYKGTAIFGTCYPGNLNEIKLTYQGSNDLNSKDFDNCKVASLLTSFSSDIYNASANVEAGFMHYECENQVQSVNNCTIENTYIGVSIYGNNGGGGINENNISLLETPIGYYFWAKGIDWNAYNPLGNSLGACLIRDNIISSTAADYAIGINFTNAPYAYVRDNTITFTSTSTLANSDSYPTLIGMSLQESKYLKCTGNTLLGPNNSSTNDIRKTCGLKLTNSTDNYFGCNTMDNFQQGITIIGNCTGYNPFASNQAGFEQNRVTTTRFGLMFRHLSNVGTIGDIGVVGSYDANNKFYSIGAGGLNQKVKRLFSQTWQCDPNIGQPKIATATSNLTSLESTSNIIGNGCSYLVINANPGSPYVCNPAINIVPTNAEDGGVTDIDRAKWVAEDQLAYSEFEPMGEYFDERTLYGQLIHDPVGLAQYPVLNNFFVAHQYTSLALLARVDDAIAQLALPEIKSNQGLYVQKLEEAIALNATVPSTQIFESNEKTMNTIYLSRLQSPTLGLGADQLSFVENLAQECPYIAGKGVYKARLYYAMLNPGAYFNDLAICNSVGVYKTQNGSTPNGLFDAENEEINNATNKIESTLLQDGLRLYPNPTNDLVTFEYGSININDNAQLIVKDITGRKVIEVSLSNTNNQQTISLYNLPKGIYSYSYILNNKTIKNGKICKE